MTQLLQSIRMSSVDTAWLHVEQPDNLMQITAVLLFDTPLNWSKLRLLLHERLLSRYPRFMMRPDNPRKAFGSTNWEHDPTFDLENQIEHVTLNSADSKAALEDLVGKTMSRPLDMARPLWRLTFVDGYEHGSAIVVRLHHAIADGIALARLVISLTDPSKSAEATKNELSMKLSKSLKSLGISSENNTLVRRAAYASNMALKAIRAFGKLIFSLPDPRTIFKGTLNVAKNAAWSNSIPFADVKQISKSYGATINDVLVAAITSAIRRYLLEHDSLVNQIHVAVPINLRPLDGPIELGNKFGLVYLPLPVGLSDADARFQTLQATMDAIKRSPEALIAHGLLGLVGLLPPAIKVPLMRMFGNKNTGVLTNVPGPRRPIYRICIEK